MEINPEYSLEGLMLKLKRQYLGHRMWRADSLEKINARKDGRQKENGATEDDGRMASLTQWTWIWGNLGDREGQGSLECCSPWGCRVRFDLATEQLHLQKFYLYLFITFLLAYKPNDSMPLVYSNSVFHYILATKTVPNTQYPVNVCGWMLITPAHRLSAWALELGQPELKYQVCNLLALMLSLF